MIVEDEYYEFNFIEIGNKEKRAKYTLFAVGVFCSLFVCFGLRHCRSPPLFNLELKNKLNGGKKMAERPKRRRYRDNPYILNSCKERNIFIVTFKDGTGKIRKTEVQEEVYKALDRFELDDIKEMNEYDRHIEHSEIYEENLCTRAMDKPTGLEDYVIQKSSFEDLKNAINLLPENQQRRIKKYYFEDKTQQQIADEEKVDIRAVQYTLNIALKKLKEILK